jgi:hypothetical protein
MHGRVSFHSDIGSCENKSRTQSHGLGPVTKSDSRVPTESFETGFGDEQRCAFIAADVWPAGAPPFCGAPVQRGSSYCPTHARICAVDPASAEGVLIALGQELAASAAAPSEMACLAPVALPEPVDEDATLDQREFAIETPNDQQQEEP